MGKVLAICISEKKGTLKNEISEAKFIEDFGIENDAHAGKWHRQVSLLEFNKIDEFRKDIYSIEKVALTPMRECLPYTSNLQKSLANLTQIKNDVVYAKEMCEDVVKIYDNMQVPALSKDEYTQELDRARINVRKTYELRTIAMENSVNLIDTKNPIYIKDRKSVV